MFTSQVSARRPSSARSSSSRTIRDPNAIWDEKKVNFVFVFLLHVRAQGFHCHECKKNEKWFPAIYKLKARTRYQMTHSCCTIDHTSASQHSNNLLQPPTIKFTRTSFAVLTGPAAMPPSCNIFVHSAVVLSAKISSIIASSSRQ